MRPTRNAIAQYLRANMGHYINPFLVETTLDEFGMFDIAAKWPDLPKKPEYTLEIVLEDVTVEQFSKLSGIKTVEQLHFVSPHRLIELFHEGVATVFCMADKPEFYCELSFRKSNGEVCVYNEEEDKRVVITGNNFDEPADFFDYMRTYISNM
ncbi:hypothetical protein FAM09_13370 [Niastella caeni]|uniref:Uncharacterized protein n=1 Tax=Niastella caeni TaxID=2569763 RepID=A0A4S8HV07_9BACT|nr:hypothetical protein [Niastella caeni]THU39488.1 hypothetical protein FAM09_13370 [Niastella caeni]